MTERESGADAGLRNIGRFFLMGIPLMLGLGAAAWLGVYAGTHDFKRQLSQEDRAAIAVGAPVRPKGPMKIDIVPSRCLPIMRADIDGSVLRLYVENLCGPITYMRWSWTMLSPDGTAIHSGWTEHG